MKKYFLKKEILINFYYILINISLIFISLLSLYIKRYVDRDKKSRLPNIIVKSY